MKNRRFLLLLVSLVVIITFGTSCLSEECGECFTPPPEFVFEVVDSQTGENLFTSGVYDVEQLQVLDSADGSSINYEFITRDNLNLIVLDDIGWSTEKIIYSFKISGENIFVLQVDAERVSEDCCNFTRFNEIIINPVESEYSQNTGIFKVKIEQ
ncbi:hypothetical protein [Marinigracilibium pacificum]|uniref:Uncharacterized protein n=1 Tax=Marinigracilibium pacificum TaxID=2729599 RepID=A0A848J4H6_9BACT|nr:hypothetical protein [Marinigracilibium pacificum]NMM49249.1 hypothetical protein [Marinigracilibium pacificum]